MILPIGSDNPLHRRPVTNYVLIVLNIAIFLATYQPRIIHTPQGNIPQSIRTEAQHLKLYPTPQYYPTPQQPQLHQFVTYAFLHANWMHIIGNMLFLYIFGNHVNDKLGHVGYLLLYLGGGVFSGLGHAMFNDNPVLGASGAVAAITGAYMVLFPKTNIHVLYVIFFIGTLYVPALYFILFYLIIWLNVVPLMAHIPDNIAYGAHLAGYAYGVGIPLGMLALKLLPHSHFDLWALIERWKRRQTYRQTVQKGYEPFTHPSKNKGTDRRIVNVKITDSIPAHPREEEIQSLRADISMMLGQANVSTAAQKYMELQKIDNTQVLGQQQQLDIVNKLMQDGNHDAAALGYEAFLKHYRKTYPLVEQIELMLGLIYSRYLNRKEPAQKYLEAALEKLTEPNQKQMCADELERLKAAD